MKLLIIFIVLNIFNVIIQTVKSIATVKSGKLAAALVNALAYGLYTVVVVYMMCDLPLLVKAGIIALCNLVGVYAVKWLEEKTRKTKLWKVETSILNTDAANVRELLTSARLSFNFIEGVGKYVVFNIFCHTEQESLAVKEILKKYNAKYFVSESKIL